MSQNRLSGVGVVLVILVKLPVRETAGNFHTAVYDYDENVSGPTTNT